MGFDIIHTADVREKRIKVKKDSESKKQILKYLIDRKDYYHSIKSIMDDLGYSYLTIYNRLKELIEDKVVERISTEKSNKHYYAYIGD